VNGGPVVPGRTSIAVVPSARGFKVSDNGSAMPQDRVYIMSNFWDDLYAAANRRFGNDLNRATGFRETIGFEKSFLDGWASVEMRLPLQTFKASSRLVDDLNAPSTAAGDLSVIFRGSVYRDVQNNNYVTLVWRCAADWAEYLRRHP